MQIEYALAAVAAGAASVGIKGTNFEIFHISLYRGSIECYKNSRIREYETSNCWKYGLNLYHLCFMTAANGVVLATEKKHRSILYEEHSVHKIEMITPSIGMVYSGMGPDYRLLVRQARKMAQQYWVVYQEQIPTAQLVQRVATLMQEYTQSG